MGAVLRIPDDVWSKVRSHIVRDGDERFALLLASVSWGQGSPILLVRDVYLVPPEDVSFSGGGWDMNPEVIIEVINRAVTEDLALVESHYHASDTPRFSSTDRLGLEDFVPYVLDSLPGRPYVATVWGDRSVYGEVYTEGGMLTPLRSVTVAGGQLRQLAHRDGAPLRTERYGRQLPWVTEYGQAALSSLRFGVVGASGTGSWVLSHLALLGAKDFVVVDPEPVAVENLNRMPHATAADIDTPKAIVARRYLRSLQPDAQVEALVCQLQTPDALDVLKGVDVLIGCVDNDGARLILNELALAYCIPYLDVGVGIAVDDDGDVDEAGATVAAVIPGHPCLNCLGLIDRQEAATFLDPPEKREADRRLGYIEGLDEPAPAVAPLNAMGASILVNELLMLIAGIRPVPSLTSLDALGRAYRLAGQHLSPVEHSRKADCLECGKAGRGDAAGIERFSRWGGSAPSA